MSTRTNQLYVFFSLVSAQLLREYVEWQKSTTCSTSEGGQNSSKFKNIIIHYNHKGIKILTLGSQVSSDYHTISGVQRETKNIPDTYVLPTDTVMFEQ